jgi:hypothetical protein
MNGRLRFGVLHARDAVQICLDGFFIDMTRPEVNGYWCSLPAVS